MSELLEIVYETIKNIFMGNRTTFDKLRIKYSIERKKRIGRVKTQ